MDIEGWEIPWLKSLEKDDLNKFKQIVIEFHGINDDSWNSTYNDKLEAFKKLSLTHYLVHVHGNNHSSITNNIPDVIEATYVRKDYFTNKPNLNTTKLPMELDYPCNKNLPDYDLNYYPFVF